MITEAQLQFQIVTYFNNNYKAERKRLFEINNSTNKGVTRKGMGLIKGVSDLGYINLLGGFIGLELKVKDSRHNIKHLETQCEWLEMLNYTQGESMGLFIYTLDDFIEFRDMLYKDKAVAQQIALESIAVMRAKIQEGKDREVLSIKV